MRRVHSSARQASGCSLLLGVLMLTVGPLGHGQQTSETPTVEKATVELLMARIEQLEARVHALEAGEGKSENTTALSCGTAASPAMKPGSPTKADTAEERASQPPRTRDAAASTAAAQTTSAVPPGLEQSQPDSAMNDRMDLNRTLLRIRGFGNVDFHGDTVSGDTTSFSLGQLDLFITSDISDHSRFLSEVVFEAGPDNIYGVKSGQENSFGVDLERYLLQYFQSDYFNLGIGRGHTAIGYYNNAYHHSTWMQTTTDRPFLFEFEDRGGILPIHIVGVTASGKVPSGAMGLHYVAEVGNGRESRNPLNSEPVQNSISDQDGKAFNLALYSRPESVHGFQTGFSVYHDLLSPANAPRIGETIVAAHAILVRPKYEWLTEGVLDRHSPAGSPIVFHTPGFYSQISKQFASYRPYFRYEYLNVPPNEPVFADVALRHGPIAGLRFDPNESVALKFEYQYTFLRNQAGVNGLTGQVGFTF